MNTCLVKRLRVCICLKKNAPSIEVAHQEPTLWPDPSQCRVPRSPIKVCSFARACIGLFAVSNQFVVPLDPPLPGPSGQMTARSQFETRCKNGYVNQKCKNLNYINIASNEHMFS